ncbi:hypothetical protein [Streptomyces sp. C10-9-1]|uniref:hypothetical protein n=1 Tax=Streptomyces sp. C10-9-1 TaxID=1859285 RepID=UPI003D759A39
MQSAPRRPVLQHLWVSPLYLIVAAFLAFTIFDSKPVGWGLLAAALVGPLVALGLHAARHERPDWLAVVPAGALVMFAVLFSLTEGLPWT